MLPLEVAWPTIALALSADVRAFDEEPQEVAAQASHVEIDLIDQISPLGIHNLYCQPIAMAGEVTRSTRWKRPYAKDFLVVRFEGHRRQSAKASGPPPCAHR